MDKIQEKIDNLVNQKKQVKLEISDLEDALLLRKKLQDKIDGGLEVLDLLNNEKENKEEKKEEKK
jgi:hypothetical protein